MFFGEKYVPENVRVVQVDGFSRSCAAARMWRPPDRSARFRITGESSIGAGLRRIEAVTGEAAEELVADRLEALRRRRPSWACRARGARRVSRRSAARVRESEKAARQPRSATAAILDVAAALAGAQQAGDVKVIVEHYPDADADALRRWADDLRGMTGASCRSPPAMDQGRRWSWRPAAT